MVRRVQDAFALRYVQIEQILQEPGRRHQKLRFAVQGFAVHRPKIRINHAADRAFGKLQHAPVPKRQPHHPVVLLRLVFRTEDFGKIRKRNTEILAADLRAAVEAVVFQFLPDQRFCPHLPDFVAVPGPIKPFRKGEREAVALPREIALRALDRSVLSSPETREEIVPHQRRVVKGLPVVAVLDVKVHDVALFPLVEGKIVLPDDADFGHRITVIKLHPVVLVHAVDILLELRVLGDIVPLRAALPYRHRTGRVFDIPVPVIQHREEGRAGRTRRAGEKISPVPREHRAHHIAHRHALHVNASAVDIVFPADPINQRAGEIDVAVLVDIVR